MSKRGKKKKLKLNLNNKKLILGSVLLILVIAFIFCLMFREKEIFSISTEKKDVSSAEKTLGTDVEAWLRVQGTNIDLPVIYADESINLASMTTSFGWTNEKIEKDNNRVAILGHNIMNVSSNPIIGDEDHSRFEQLMSYVYLDFVEDNKYIEYTVNGESKIYAIYSVTAKEYYKINDYNFNFTNEESSEYVKQAKDDSYFKFDIDVTGDDKLLTLITCTRMFGPFKDMSFVVEARELRDNEKAVNYGVSEKDSYKEVREIMEGEVQNEEEV